MNKVLLSIGMFCLWSLNLCYGQSFDKAITATDKLLTHLVEDGNIAGLAIAIYHKDKLIWKEEYGYANLEYAIPATDSSKFRIASISKLYTGTAILKLHQSGKLHLDDAISKYIDSLPTTWQTITIRQIAQHTSGIGHYLDVPDALDVHHYTSSQEAIDKFKNRPLLHAPDEGVSYSSYTYTVLAAIIEKVTQKNFPKAMDGLIFDPLQMNQTEVDHQKRIIKNRTGFYQYDSNRQPEHAPYINLSGRWAGSGFLSSAKDLAKFGAYHTNNSNFFDQEELALLTAPRQVNDTLKTKEGLGWGQRNDWEGRLMYWGDGSTPGSKGGLLVYPEQNLSIAILSNMRSAPLERGEFQILAIRFLAALEGKQTSELKADDFGAYNLNISIGANSYTGKLTLQSNEDNLGNFDFQGVQQFTIIDAFWKENQLWIFPVGGGNPPIPIGIMPIHLDSSENKIEGKIYRIDASITGQKQ